MQNRFVHEDENSLGELYISEIQFEKIEDILEKLNKKREEADKWTEELREIVEGNDRFVVWKSGEATINNGIFEVPLPLIVLD
ncbi:hypothetical protein IIA94_01520, partial [Patescibacteria group bacterium]|nr:hypothetical protein [Patescibacteria group bacterium]